jgi:hypothetical protein
MIGKLFLGVLFVAFLPWSLLVVVGLALLGGTVAAGTAVGMQAVLDAREGGQAGTPRTKTATRPAAKSVGIEWYW